MGRSHLLVGAGVLLIAGFAGCSANKPNQTARRAAPTPAPAARDASTPTAGPQAGARGGSGGEVVAGRVGDVAPQTLAQHAEVYAQNFESMLARRGGNAAAGAPPAALPDAHVHAADESPHGQGAHGQGAKAPAEVIVPPSAPVKEEVAALANTPVQAKPEQPAPAAPTSRPSVPEPRQARNVAPLPGAAQPAGGRSVASTTDLLSQKLTTRVKEYPGDAAAHLDYQLLQFLRDESVPDLGSIAPLPAEDRELLSALLDGLSNFRGGLRAEANMLQSKKIAPLLEMGDRIRSQGELNIPAMALCTSVTTFGVYEPMEPAEFKSGPQNAAVLYCEVANFASQLNSKKQWETRLKHEAVIYSETGLDVWQDKPDTVTDLSRNRRHDFYVVKKLLLPNLPVGRYLLKVTVTDLQMNRVAEATAPIQMVAP